MPDEPTYLAIRNWSKRQPGRQGKSEWIKDYTDKDSDEDYEKLTFFQRQVLDGCRRLRGRLGKNPPNDPMYIARALHAGVTDRPHIGHAISTLLVRGLLVLTNQQVDLLDKEIEIDKKKSKRRKNISAEASSAPPSNPAQIRALILLPLNSGEEFAIEEADFAKWKQYYPAVDVMQELRKMAAWLDAKPDRRKTRRGVKAFIVRWLSRAQDDPKAAASFRIEQNGSSDGKSTAERKIDQIRETAARVEQRITGVPNGPPSGIPAADGRRGTGHVVGEPELLPPVRDQAGSGRHGPKSS